MKLLLDSCVWGGALEELAIVRGMAHSGILRLVNISARQQAKICLNILERYGQELQAGALVTTEADRIRIRPPQDWRSSV